MPRNRQNKESRRWPMYPSLRTSIANLLAEENLIYRFYRNDNDAAASETYDTFIMGKFTCNNPSCKPNGWSSKKLAITIRKYHGHQYNARVYHQRCKSSNSLSRPFRDDSSSISSPKMGRYSDGGS